MIKKSLKIIIPLITVIVVLLIFASGGHFKAKYEITEKTLKSVTKSSYTGNDSTVKSSSQKLGDGDLGIECGKVIKLGTCVAIDTFEIKEKVVSNNMDIAHIISPSRQYELIVYKEKEEDVDNYSILDQPVWYVWGIRSTNPDVATTRGIQIIQSKRDIKKKTQIEFSGNKPEIIINGCTIRFQFDCGLLTEVYMHV